MKPTSATPLLSARYSSHNPRATDAGLPFPEPPAAHFPTNLLSTRTVDSLKAFPPVCADDEVRGGPSESKVLLSTPFFPNADDTNGGSGTKSTLDPSAHLKNLSNHDANFTLSSTPLSKRCVAPHTLGKNRSTKQPDDSPCLEPSPMLPRSRQKILIDLQAYDHTATKPVELETSNFTALAANYASNSTQHFQTLTNYNSQGSGPYQPGTEHISARPSLHEPPRPKKSFEITKSVRNVGVLASRYSSNAADSNGARKSVENLEQAEAAMHPGREGRLPRSSEHRRESHSESKKTPKLPKSSSKAQILAQIRTTLHELEEMCHTKPEGSRMMDSKSLRSIRNGSFNKSEKSLAHEAKSLRSFLNATNEKRHKNATVKTADQPLTLTPDSRRLPDIMTPSPAAPTERRFDFAVQVEDQTPMFVPMPPVVRDSSQDATLNRTSVLDRKIASTSYVHNKTLSLAPNRPELKSLRVANKLLENIQAKYSRGANLSTTADPLPDGLSPSAFQLDINLDPRTNVYAAGLANRLPSQQTHLMQWASRPLRSELPRPQTALGFSTLRDSSRALLHQNLQQINDLEKHNYFRTITPASTDVQPSPKDAVESPTDLLHSSHRFAPKSCTKSVSKLNVYGRGWSKNATTKSNGLRERPESSQASPTFPSPHLRDSKTPSFLAMDKHIGSVRAIPEERESEQASFRRTHRHSVESKIQILERILLIFDQEAKRSEAKLKQARSDYEAKLDVLISLKGKIEALGGPYCDKKALRCDLESFYSRMKLRLNDYLNYLDLHTSQHKRACKLMMELRLRLLNLRSRSDPQAELEECTVLCDKIKPLVTFATFQGQIDLEYQLQKLSDEISCRPEFVPDTSADSRFYSVANPNLSVLSFTKANMSRLSGYTAEMSSVMKMVDSIRDRHQLEERRSNYLPKASERPFGLDDPHLRATAADFSGRKPVFRKLKLPGDALREDRGPMSGKKELRGKFFRPISSQHQ